MTLASREAPYGSWKSPITADMIATQSLSLGEVAVDGDDVYWLEVRPGDRGRHAIARRTADGALSDILPIPGEGKPTYSARSLVYGHGGGSFAVSEGRVVFVNHAPGGTNPYCASWNIRSIVATVTSASSVTQCGASGYSPHSPSR